MHWRRYTVGTHASVRASVTCPTASVRVGVGMRVGNFRRYARRDSIASSDARSDGIRSPSSPYSPMRSPLNNSCSAADLRAEIEAAGIAIDRAKPSSPALSPKDSFKNQLVPTQFLDRRGQCWRRSDKCIGKGAYGEVWMGMSDSGGLVALKALPIRQECGGVGKECLDEVMQEVLLLSALRHDNIVAYLSSAFAAGHVLVCMEYVSGGSLASVMKNFGVLSASSVKRLNLLAISDDNRIVGTPAYMAPEACRRDACASSDVWGLGITVIEMLEGTAEINGSPQLQHGRELIPSCAPRRSPWVPHAKTLPEWKVEELCDESLQLGVTTV
eukprot:gene57989-biopygen101401